MNNLIPRIIDFKLKIISSGKALVLNLKIKYPGFNKAL